LYGKPYIEDMIGDVRYRISPLSFYQVNPVQTRKMYDTVVEFAGLTGKETVWDLYCGIGTISLYIAGNAEKVYGVEVIPAAVDNARDNARLNGIGNVEFFLGKAEDVVPEFYERESGDGSMLHPDVMVVDPPRKGCDPALIDTMLKMSPKRIVYVSCDSATLGRDLKLLCGGGEYELVKVRCFDNFCQGVHVETVVLLSQQKTDDRMNMR
jgi:23S rRNA (uracil1939-C5)-methyltransferase